MTIAPAPWQLARAKSALPSSQPVALMVTGADALSSISFIVGTAFFAAYEFAGRGRAGVLAGLATVPVVGVGLWAFGKWYAERESDNVVATEPEKT